MSEGLESELSNAEELGARPGNSTCFVKMLNAFKMILVAVFRSRTSYNLNRSKARGTTHWSGLDIFRLFGGLIQCFFDGFSCDL